MSPQAWKIVGVISLQAAFVFAALSLFKVYGRSPIVIQTAIAPGPGRAVIPAIPPTALVYAVLSGVGFFVGLACFLWSAMVEARQQRAEILEHLALLLHHQQSRAGD